MLMLQQCQRREALKLCCCSAKTEKRSCRILLLEKLLESFVRGKVDYKQLSRLAVSSCQWRPRFLSFKFNQVY